MSSTARQSSPFCKHLLNDGLFGAKHYEHRDEDKDSISKFNIQIIENQPECTEQKWGVRLTDYATSTFSSTQCGINHHVIPYSGQTGGKSIE